jgi:tetratricopeptide (TPR) repeat protein
MAAPVEFRYRAFISYSHADTKWANWLHGRLESFRIDRDLIGRQTAVGLIPKTLRPIFRDRDDFTAGHSLSEQTLAALDASAALIVLGSPDAAKSHYVNEEVRLFQHRAQDGAARGDERLQKALDLLKANKPQDAEPLFQTVAEEKAARVRADTARLEKHSKDAAAAYRNLGAIAGLGDPRRAQEAYAKALEFDGEDLEALYWYGYLNFLAGDLGAAQRPLARLLETATQLGDQRGIYRAHLGLGQVMKGRGSLPSARDHEEKALDIALGQSAVAKDDLEWERDVSEAQVRMGDVLRAEGNLPAALDSYKAAHAIRERLTTADPGKADWQRDLANSHNNIGLVLQAQGNLPAALDSYKAAYAITERLITTDSENADWQRDVANSHINIGDVLRAQGNLSAALESYNAAQAIRERLITARPA